MKKFSHEDIQKRSFPDSQNLYKYPISVMIEDVRSLYNVGSIFRTSDGAGIEKLYLGGYTGTPPRKDISKTALGASETVPWEKVENCKEKILSLKEMGYTIAVCEHTDNGVNYSSANYSFPLCIILGNEVEGVSDELCELADFAIEIPMFGLKQSLNISVAYGIVIYRIVESYIEKAKDISPDEYLFFNRIPTENTK